MKKFIIFLIILIIFVIGIFGLFYKNLFILKSPELNMKITSGAFSANKEIPSKYSCDGKNINPPLKILGIPKEAKTLVLIVDDPDAPLGTWVHWVVFNIDPSISEILEGGENIGTGGINDFKKLGYGGPCPPSGTHRYFFKVYALDRRIELEEGATKSQIEKAMKGYILDSAELVGTYSKK